jgi:hypothetical protein
VARGRLSPLPDPALKGAQLTIREDAGEFSQAVRTDILHLPARVVVTAAAIARRRTATISSRG